MLEYSVCGLQYVSSTYTSFRVRLIIISHVINRRFNRGANGLAPEYLSELFAQNSVHTTMRLRNTKADLRVPLFKKSNRQKSISFHGPKLWNQLSSDVKLAPSLATFKRRRKKKILEG